MIGALYQHVTAPREGKYRYAPTNVNFGLLPPVDHVAIGVHHRDKQAKRRHQISLAVAGAEAWGGRPAQGSAA
jgi:folate-dependent tRNA-U54 methylase TrmFO/GidA